MESGLQRSEALGPDGVSWALRLRVGAKQMKSKGYNGVPEAYSELRVAVYKLVEEAGHEKRESQKSYRQVPSGTATL